MEPLEVFAGPNGVPDNRPLPVGKGRGASFCRAGFTGGVGAAEGVPALAESDFFMGIDIFGVDSFSTSTSMGLEPTMVVGRGNKCGSVCAITGGGLDTMAAGETGADMTDTGC